MPQLVAGNRCGCKSHKRIGLPHGTKIMLSENFMVLVSDELFVGGCSVKFLWKGPQSIS